MLVSAAQLEERRKDRRCGVELACPGGGIFCSPPHTLIPSLISKQVEQKRRDIGNGMVRERLVSNKSSAFLSPAG